MINTLPTTKIHLSGELITPKLNKLIDEKVKMFRKNKMNDADFYELVGCLTDYEFLVKDIKAGGHCSGYTKEIVLLGSTFDIGEDLQVRNHSNMVWVPSLTYKRKVVLHEISHALQFELEFFEKDEYLLSTELGYEWQAESIAYKLHKEMFGELYHGCFDSYFNLPDVKFLRDWHKGIEQDCFIKEI